MPIPVTQYRCAFKCGRGARASKKDVAKHEEKCFNNPENKTCATCSNQIYIRDDGIYRACKIKKMDDFLDRIQELLRVEGIGHLKPLFHCPSWNKETEGYGTENYTSEVEILLNRSKTRNEIDVTDDLPF